MQTQFTNNSKSITARSEKNEELNTLKGHVTLTTKLYNFVVQQRCTTILYNKFCFVRYFLKHKTSFANKLAKHKIYLTNMLAKHNTCLDKGNNVSLTSVKQGELHCEMHCKYYVVRVPYSAMQYSTVKKTIVDSILYYGIR